MYFLVGTGIYECYEWFDKTCLIYMNDLKLCKDCKYFYQLGASYTCRHPLVSTATEKVDLVTGRRYEVRDYKANDSCRSLREVYGLCGPSGKLYWDRSLVSMWERVKSFFVDGDFC